MLLPGRHDHCTAGLSSPLPYAPAVRCRGSDRCYVVILTCAMSLSVELVQEYFDYVQAPSKALVW
eukprot:3716702-Rhodomonas_salina.4